MSHYLSVEVLDSDGDPVKHAKVSVWLESNLGLRGGRLEPAFTDDSGHAEFETAQDYDDSHELYIRVKDQRFGPFEISGGSYTVQLD